MNCDPQIKATKISVSEKTVVNIYIDYYPHIRMTTFRIGMSECDSNATECIKISWTTLPLLSTAHKFHTGIMLSLL